MGEEIRRRLEASFEAEKAPVAPKTRQLLDAICHFVDETGRDFGSWSDDPFAFEVLKGAVNMLMAHDKPKGKPDPNPKPDGVGELLYGPSPSPEDVSRFLAGTWIKDRANRVRADKE